jgi:hypothetical protein
MGSPWALQDACLLRLSMCLLQAQEQLFHARRVLGYSYAYAFYMFGSVMFREEITPEQNTINQNLFEDQQQQLEAEVGVLRGHTYLPKFLCWGMEKGSTGKIWTSARWKCMCSLN